YYTTMLDCVDDFHTCKKTYQDYLSTGTGSIGNKLLSISGAISQYEDFQTDQLYFKDTLIVKSFYDEKNYPIVIDLGKKILIEQPGYRPVMKMIAQSYFELGNYNEAKQYLNDLYELDKQDPDVAYMLGVINRELGELVLSNILLNQAIKNKYTPSVFPYRFLINNYLDLDRPTQALQSFDELLSGSSGSITKDDILLASYYNIIYDNLPKAESIINSGIQAFSEEADFYGFLGWIYKEKLDFVLAMEQLEKGYELDSKNAMISLNIAQVHLLEKEKKQAIIYLKQTVKNDKGGQFGSVAQDLLDEL
ncbi:tetratricopeptide repeat protein, partial [Candidatus Gracilibacteria bacterium]|nr:tetratricopeptide repeat protein [Candidatus Gracilibacteria bacterium]